MLAKELGVSSKVILEKCRKEGLNIKNHMSVLSAGQEATIREWFSEGEHTTTVERAERVDLKKLKEQEESKAAVAPEAKEEETKGQPSTEKLQEQEKDIEKTTKEQPASDSGIPATITAEKATIKEQPKVETETEKEKTDEAKLQEAKAETKPAEQDKTQSKEVSKETTTELKEAPKKVEKPTTVKPAGPTNIPAPAVLRGPKIVRIEKPQELPLRFQGKESKPYKTHKVAAKEEEEEGFPKRRKGRPVSKKGRERESLKRDIRDWDWGEKDLRERTKRIEQAAQHPTLILKQKLERPKEPIQHKPKEKVKITEPIILKDFCAATGIPFSKLFPKLLEHNVPATINQTISSDIAELLAMEFGIELEIVRQKSKYEELIEQYKNRTWKNPKRRDPIVIFMGHVDHGKTSLLDRIRNSRITETEAGGITQHIGAYRYPIQDGFIVFLDTPGHEAFTALRARGAQVTDIAVLVVAADDGVMPQTVEAISHARAANVPIVVALNKIDLPNIDEPRVLGQLAEQGLVPVEWGGETDVIRTSAATGQGVDELLEHLYTLAEVMDLKADPTLPATGVILESKHDPNKGPIAHIIIQDGTLKKGDVIVAGKAFGRVRAMIDDFGNSIDEAGPSTPVELLGLNEVPEAGEKFYVVEDLKIAQQIAEERRQEEKARAAAAKPRISLESLFEQVESGQLKSLNLIVKADTQGSLDAITKKLSELSTDEIQIKILHAAIGGITEGDVMLADASEGIIIGFCVVPDERARNKAQELNVQIRTYTIIYHMLEDIEAALEGMLAPAYEEKILGRAVVKEVFKISKIGTVAGCMVTEGLIERSAKVRIIRDNVILREEAEIESLKRFKEDVRQVREGFECGIKIANFDDVKQGDIIEVYKIEEVKRTLESIKSDK